MKTARLYQRSSGIWWGSWTADGITVRRSTRVRSEAEAQAVIAGWKLEPAASFKFDEMGLVYFAEAVGIAFIKIGWTRTDGLEQRLAALQVGNPLPLRVVASFPGRMFDEHQEHRRFSDDWVRGEWFNHSDRVEARVRELTEIREPQVEHKRPE